MPRRVSAPDDLSQMIESRILDVVDPQNRIERTALALVRELHVLDVVGRRAGLFGHGKHRFLGDVDEICAGIDEALDQPRAGDAIDLRALSRDPFPRSHPDVAAGRQSVLGPAGKSAIEIDGLDAGRSERGGNALADIVALPTIHDHRPSQSQVGPAGNLVRRLMERGNDQPVARARNGAPNIDDDRR